MADLDPDDSPFVSRLSRHSSPSRVSRASNSSLVINEGFKPPVQQDFAPTIRFRHQFKALFLKDLQIQLRAVVTNICQLLVPVIFISFAGLMQLIVNHLLHKNGDVVPGSDSLGIPVDVGRVIACNQTTGGHPDVCYDEVFNFLLTPYWQDLPVQLDIEKLLDEIAIEGQMPKQNVLYDLPFYYIGKDRSVNLPLGVSARQTTDKSSRGFEELMVPSSLLFNFSLDFTINPNYTNRHFDEHVQPGPGVQIPFFLPIPGGDNGTGEMQQRLVNVTKEYNELANGSQGIADQYDRVYMVSPLSQEQFSVILSNVKNRDYPKVRPHGAMYINKFTSSNSSVDLNYTLLVNDLTLYTISDLSLSVGNMSSSGTVEVQRRNNLINMMHNAALKHLDSSLGDDFVPITTFVMPLPTSLRNLTVDLTTILGGILYPFSASFLLPVFIASLVKDKFERHLIMMEQNGLSRFTYWTVTYIFNYTLYVIIALVITIISLIWQVRLFTQTNALVLIVMLWLWGHAQVVLGFFFSVFFNRTRTATIIGYLLVIASVLVAELLEALNVFSDDHTPFFLYMLYPPFCFYRLLYYTVDACAELHCYGVGVLGEINLVTIAMLYLGGSTILLIFVSMYLSYVLPSEYGVRKSPFFPIIGLCHGMVWILKKSGLIQVKCQFKDLQMQSSTVSLLVEDDEEGEVDEDVRREEEDLTEGFPDDAPVVIYKLRKEYSSSTGSPPHVAVDCFSLAIERNECFGLLGPNGAGKTTLISVLTGLYEPTQGTARIAGLDLLTQMSAIHRHLGVCPQFNIQYPELSAEQHLLFYARLKGVKWKKEKSVVKRALKQVNLYDARKRQSKNLSGGMRRRLSVAMACIGNPDILILDEPTTGLDPVSRRQVWEVIERVKEGRSVILTTHAMEEADHLCTRIGIMNYGKLRCLGSQSRLKAKFGSGYQLQFHCSPGCVQEVERYVHTNLQFATHVETYADSCTYQLEKEELVVSELFEMLDSVRDQIGIVDWGIKMTTLEDVFLNIVKMNRDLRLQIDGSLCPSWLPCSACFRRSTTE